LVSYLDVTHLHFTHSTPYSGYTLPNPYSLRRDAANLYLLPVSTYAYCYGHYYAGWSNQYSHSFRHRNGYSHAHSYRNEYPHPYPYPNEYQHSHSYFGE